jgi:hypothetical protein
MDKSHLTFPMESHRTESVATLTPSNTLTGDYHGFSYLVIKRQRDINVIWDYDGIHELVIPYDFELKSFDIQYTCERFTWWYMIHIFNLWMHF